MNDADITELDLTAVHLREVQHQWSEEITIAQQRQGLTWIAGLFVFDEADAQPTSITLRAPRLENRLNPSVEADNQAVFGQATIDLIARVSATAGLRYSREHKTIDNAGHLSTLDVPVTLVAGTASWYTDAISHTAWTPKFGLEFRARENTYTYVSATRGFKSGGFNFTSPEAGRGYAPEWVWSYEGGLKAVVASGRANFNVAVFHTDYTDLQVQTAIRPGVIDISNAAEATIRGVELEGAARVTQALHAGGHVAWLAAKYDRYIAVGVGGITGDVAGNRLTNAPRVVWAALASVEGQSRASGLGDAPSRLQMAEHGLFHALQRQHSAAAFVRPARRERVSSGRSTGSGRSRPRRGTSRTLTYITGTFSTPLPAIGGRPGAPRQAGVQLTIRR